MSMHRLGRCPWVAAGAGLALKLALNLALPLIATDWEPRRVWAEPPTVDAADPPTVVVAGPSARRLLFSAIMTRGVGLVVQRVEPESPVRDMRRADNPGMRVILEPGDIVTHVDGQRIDSLPTYYRLLAEGGEAVRVTLVNRRTGRSLDAVARPVGGRPGAPPAGPPPQPPPPTGVVRVLLVGDTKDEKIGKLVGNSAALMRLLLKQYVSRVDIEVIDGDGCQAATIISRVKELGRRAGRDDTLFVWFDAHGAYDPSLAAGDPSGGHFFGIPGGSLPRKLLFDTLLVQPGKLKVLLSSSCNTAGVARPADGLAEMSTVTTRVMTVRGPTNLERLLHYHRGYLDMNGAKRDQFDFGSFTCLAFADLAPQHATWSSLIPQLAAEVDAEYRRWRTLVLEDRPREMSQTSFEAMKNQEHLNPVVFQQRLEAEPVPAGGALRELAVP